jgi:O-antigen ligase
MTASRHEGDRGRSLIITALLALLVGIVPAVAAWQDGGMARDGQIVAGLGLAAGVAVNAVLLMRAGGYRALAWDPRWGWPLIGVLGFVAIQALNASHHFLPDSRALVPRPHLPGLPRGVDRGTVTGALALGMAYAITFWLARCCLGGRRERAVFVLTQVLCGVTMAVLVLHQRQSPPPGAQYPLTGTVVNSNQYAAYANMALALALAWAGECWTAVRSRVGRVAACGALVGAALLLLASIARSGSRMGVLVGLGVVSVMAVLAVARQGLLRRWMAAGLAVAGAVAIAWWATRGLQGCEGGWSVRQMGDNVASRCEVQRTVAGMIPDRWLAGFGAGTFELAFPYYQGERLKGAYRHAHNEYLQGAVELGLGGVALLALFVLAACGRPAVSALWRAPGFWERTGMIVALGAVALHAMTDFPFRMPMVSLAVAALLGMSGGRLGWREDGGEA